MFQSLWLITPLMLDAQSLWGCRVLKSCLASIRSYFERENFERQEGDWWLEGRQKRCGRSEVLRSSECIFIYIVLCLKWVVVCWSSRLWQHQTSYQDRYWFATVCTDGDFLVLSHWALAPWPNFPLSHIILTLTHYPHIERTSPCPKLSNTKCQAR